MNNTSMVADEVNRSNEQSTLEEIERNRKYAWDYFQLHSSQRIATFNFYITLATAVLVGAGAVLQPTVNLPLFGLVLGIVLVAVSFVFWKLDERNRMLIKNAEEALKKIEQELDKGKGRSAYSLFWQDEQNLLHYRKKRSFWFWKNFFSYSDCFHLMFGTFSLFGLIGIILSFVALLKL